ncbi:GrpB family protein [Paenibacillus sp. SC116]|uniref:GrpB family protein n=1 Tax=Paenibacillus sp. SC116 TaxID=2968986 RepID=UPI00215AE31D|nr:GrpB family protein [Paenibacillus sp. SC116]MCR8845641.1 GrpB family protein [Paenibacillus sp. SC116]
MTIIFWRVTNGRTSIPNLLVKPIIDVMAKIKSFSDLEEIVERQRTIQFWRGKVIWIQSPTLY